MFKASYTTHNIYLQKQFGQKAVIEFLCRDATQCDVALHGYVVVVSDPDVDYPLALGGNGRSVGCFQGWHRVRHCLVYQGPGVHAGGGA